MSGEVAFYGHWICPFATRVQFALHQRAIDHDLIDLPPSAVRGSDFVLPPEFIEHSPRREIPMLRIGQHFLADSIPILLWMESEIAENPLMPTDESARAVVLDRMAWIDRHAFGPMVGVYYGTKPDLIAHAAEELADALAEMGRWTDESGWLAGPDITLAEAVAMPIHVRLASLQHLGFDVDVSPSFVAHGERCRSLDGWAGVAWSAQQSDKFVGRFNAYRRKHRDSRDRTD